MQSYKLHIKVKNILGGKMKGRERKEGRKARKKGRIRKFL
jgi:hypothetical protein